jgi:hypothetical protein
METKEELVENIKEWVKMESDIAKLRKDMRDINNRKKTITESLLKVMKNNEIDCFDINGGSLIYKKNKVKKPLSGKTLLNLLQTYYKEDTNMAEELSKYIMENREEQIKETIKLK